MARGVYTPRKTSQDLLYSTALAFLLHLLRWLMSAFEHGFKLRVACRNGPDAIKL